MGGPSPTTFTQPKPQQSFGGQQSFGNQQQFSGDDDLLGGNHETQNYTKSNTTKAPQQNMSYGDLFWLWLQWCFLYFIIADPFNIMLI